MTILLVNSLEENSMVLNRDTEMEITDRLRFIESEGRSDNAREQNSCNEGKKGLDKHRKNRVVN